jgi:galactose mutarotase-like enzyme
MHQLQNEHISIEVSSLGAELTSLTDKQNHIEHIWQADPAVWGWHAPTLFPVVGRSIKDQIIIDGKAYPMPQHGFARRSEFILTEKRDDLLRFKLSASDKTLVIYPYLFDFHISYEIKDNTLIQTFEVYNTGEDSMYFQLGGHPGFAVPFLTGETYEDYYLEFEKDTFLDREHIDENGFFDQCGSNVIDGTNKLPLEKDMFSADAIVIKDPHSRKVYLRSNKNPHTVSVEFPAFNYLGLWAKVGAPYICIEPWRGCADTEGKPTELKDKEGIISLEANGKFQASIIITIS